MFTTLISLIGDMIDMKNKGKGKNNGKKEGKKVMSTPVRLLPHAATPVAKVMYKPPIVEIGPTALEKMNYIIELNDKEVGWLGTVKLENGVLRVMDVFLFDQQVHATTCELTPAGLADFGTKLLEREDGVEVFNAIRLWGHSHVNMATSASGQDDSQMALFKESVKNTEDNWFLRCIGNKSGRIQFTFYDYAHQIIVEDMQWSLPYPAGNEELKAEIDAEVKEKVRNFTTPVQVITGNRSNYGTTVTGTKIGGLSGGVGDGKTIYDNGFFNEWGVRVEGKWYTWREIKQNKVLDEDYVLRYIAKHNGVDMPTTKGTHTVETDKPLNGVLNPMEVKGYVYTMCDNGVDYPVITLYKAEVVEYYFNKEQMFEVFKIMDDLKKVIGYAEYIIESKVGIPVHVTQYSADALIDYVKQHAKEIRNYLKDKEEQSEAAGRPVEVESR